MKSKRQIIEHLGSTPYGKRTVYKILGFLVAEGHAELGEKIEFKTFNIEEDEKLHTFEDFVVWYEDEEVWNTLLEDICDAMNEATEEGDEEGAERAYKQLRLVLSWLGQDLDEIVEEAEEENEE